MGPRPLHLVDGNTPSFIASAATTNPVATQLPSPPPSSSTSSPFTKPNVRRHSSISYRSSDQIIDSSRSPSSRPQPSLMPSPFVISSSHISVISPTEGDQGGERERSPLTLAEQSELNARHSDLLHFIAQKESKCLELRSQLATLEAEILQRMYIYRFSWPHTHPRIQVKRKWERVVNRGFLDSSLASITTQGNSAIFEGIVEGVQGVGRLIASGLAIGEQTTPFRSLSSMSRSLQPTHSYSQSNSSSVTYVTKSSRLSRSSASSIMEDMASAPATNEEDDDIEPTQILMVHDTGATPTMSPNPAFERQRQQQRQTDLQPDLMAPLLNNSRLRRRKSRDAHSRAVVPCEGLSTSSNQSVLTSTEAAKKEAMRGKRATVHGTNFLSVSSIPGLAALTVGPASPVSSWVENIGKKWEGLQRGSTFSKNQKRASILSDVSHSIVSALSSPSPLVSTPSSPVPSYFDPSAPSTESKSPFNTITRTSLNDNFNIPASPRTMLAPSVATQLKPCSDSFQQQQPLGPIFPPTSIPVNEKTKLGAQNKDEWNW
ncbi:hypothetical protein C0995_015779 [Termitomyces sp. Mi166|nr:hypothetical protein C0995_015779 [Termitomyces sp. Mi166\